MNYTTGTSTVDDKLIFSKAECEREVKYFLSRHKKLKWYQKMFIPVCSEKALFWMDKLLKSKTN